MIKQLAKSIREYRITSSNAPILVTGEVVMECIIPFLITSLINEVKDGCNMNMILKYGVVLVCMAFIIEDFRTLKH